MTNLYRMRRHARGIRRSRLQPMMLITGNDQLPEAAIVLIARWAWQYRSELMPVFAPQADLVTVLRHAEPADKSEIYTALRLRLTYHPGPRTVSTRAEIGRHVRKGRVRGPSRTISPNIWTRVTEYAPGAGA